MPIRIMCPKCGNQLASMEEPGTLKGILGCPCGTEVDAFKTSHEIAAKRAVFIENLRFYGWTTLIIFLTAISAFYTDATQALLMFLTLVHGLACSFWIQPAGHTPEMYGNAVHGTTLIGGISLTILCLAVGAILKIWFPVYLLRILLMGAISIAAEYAAVFFALQECIEWTGSQSFRYRGKVGEFLARLVPRFAPLLVVFLTYYLIFGMNASSKL